MAFIMSLIERSNPPGVSSWITTASAPSISAFSRLFNMYSLITGFTMPSTFT
jgi:hypothetical protein